MDQKLDGAFQNYEYQLQKHPHMKGLKRQLVPDRERTSVSHRCSQQVQFRRKGRGSERQDYQHGYASHTEGLDQLRGIIHRPTPEALHESVLYLGDLMQSD